ncbi:MAG: transcriptional regulator BetI [Verrucomicrobiaceae bacterium]|nr:transcriptional regulator BetI [Verrucomicrobiaceae bacterium]
MPKIVNHEERREFIARVSAEIIAEQGLEQATIREIAQRTGFSKGVIEHYFEDKDHIIDMALEWIGKRYLQRERRAVGEKKGLAALKTRLLCSWPLTKESQQEWRIRLRFWSIAVVQKEAHPILGKLMLLTRERLIQNIDEAKALGEVPASIDTIRTTSMLIHISTGLSCNVLVAPMFYNKRYIRETVDNIIADLRSPNVHLMSLITPNDESEIEEESV